jgi:hypothetical protein
MYKGQKLCQFCLSYIPSALFFHLNFKGISYVDTGRYLTEWKYTFKNK